MNTMLLFVGLLSGTVALAQTNPVKGPGGPPPEPANAPAPAEAKPAETTVESDPPALQSDLERHPYRMFGEKQCYLTSLLSWEKLNPARRSQTPNPMPVWKPFQGSVVQLLDTGLVLQAAHDTVFVKHYPEQKSLAIGQALAFHAIRVKDETRAYTNAAGSELKLETYDYGVPFHPKVLPYNMRTNLAALYRAQLIKSLDDQIASLENTENQLRDRELYLKRIKSAPRQPRVAVAREQYGIKELEAQRANLSQQITALKNQKAQIEAASGSGTNSPANLTTNLEANASASATNSLSGGNTNTRPNRFRNRLQNPGSP